MLGGVQYRVLGGFNYLSTSSYDVYGPVNVSYSRRRDSAIGDISEAAPTASISSTYSDYTIRRTVPEVRLQFSVADERGRLVPDIVQSDIRILDDDVPVEHIQTFEKLSNLPLRVGLLLDVSDSMKRTMEQEKSVALAFLKEVVRPGTDRAFVTAFGETVRIWQDPTGDIADLVGAVNRARQPGDDTEFFDAVYSGCVGQWKSPESGPVHRVLVVISDGEDTGSSHGLSDVIAAAQSRETQIYTINVHLRKRTYPGDGVLQRLAEQTGGRFFVANNARETDAIFAELEQELRTQYYVSFRPQGELPGYHALNVEIESPRKLMVHARRGYYALNQ